MQTVLEAYRSQLQSATPKLQLRGAVPELLVLYDFAGTNTLSPLLTVPDSALESFEANSSFKEVYRYINQYDAGAAEGLPSRRGGTVGNPGGDACGPTSLRMALNTLGLDHSATNLYHCTMDKGLTVPPGEINAFAWARAKNWLEGNTNSQLRTGLPARLPATTRADYLCVSGASSVSNYWPRIDQLLTSSNHQPVLLRTDLTSLLSGRGGGHVILLLGRGHSEFVQQAYGLSGDYYVVADPAGHYFANTNGTHYGRVTNLMAQCVGINYGGWSAIYPVELLRDRIQSDASGGLPLIKALTIGVPFPPADRAQVEVHSPVSIVVTDPLGRRSGWQADGQILEEIPDSWFSFETADEEEGGTLVFTNGVKTVVVNYPRAGTYQVQLTGTGNGSFTLDWNVLEPGGSPARQSISDTISFGQQRTYLFNLGAAAPRLEIRRAGTQTLISWPASASGFVLQSTTDLAVPGSWTAVPISTFLNGGQLTVTNTNLRAAEWFRLRKP